MAYRCGAQSSEVHRGHVPVAWQSPPLRARSRWSSCACRGCGHRCQQRYTRCRREAHPAPLPSPRTGQGSQEAGPPSPTAIGSLMSGQQHYEIKSEHLMKPLTSASTWTVVDWALLFQPTTKLTHIYEISYSFSSLPTPLLTLLFLLPVACLSQVFSRTRYADVRGSSFGRLMLLASLPLAHRSCISCARLYSQLPHVCLLRGAWGSNDACALRCEPLRPHTKSARHSSNMQALSNSNNSRVFRVRFQGMLKLPLHCFSVGQLHMAHRDWLLCHIICQPYAMMLMSQYRYSHTSRLSSSCCCFLGWSFCSLLSAF